MAIKILNHYNIWVFFRDYRILVEQEFDFQINNHEEINATIEHVHIYILKATNQ